jgi:hypothetical protein
MKTLVSLLCSFLFVAFAVQAAIPDADALVPMVSGATVTGLVYIVVKSGYIKLPTGVAGQYLTPMQLEQHAEGLSHFGGGGMSFYTGEGDDFLNFEGDIKSFAAELDKNVEKQFTVSLANANAANRIPILFAGYKKGNSTLMPGQLVEGAFNDKNAAVGLTGATQEAKSIEELQLFLNECPTRLIAMKVQNTTAPNQLLLNLTYQRHNPFKEEETKTIRPKNWVNQDTFQNDQVTFPVDVQIDALSHLDYAIIGSATTFITFYFGASLSASHALEEKASRARTNIAVVGAKRIVQDAKNKKFIGRG